MIDKIKVYAVMGCDEESVWLESVWSVLDWAIDEELRLNSLPDVIEEGVSYYIDIMPHTLNQRSIT